MGMLFGGSRQPKENPMQQQAQAFVDARNQALQVQQGQEGYQQVSKTRRSKAIGGVSAVSSGGFFGAGGRSSNAGSERRNTFLGA